MVDTEAPQLSAKYDALLAEVSDKPLSCVYVVSSCSILFRKFCLKCTMKSGHTPYVKQFLWFGNIVSL